MKNFSYIKTLVLALAVIITFASGVTYTHAQMGGGGGSSSGASSATSANTVPVSDVLNAPKHSYQQMKESYLDGLVTTIAKQLLHQITTSVVNWINSGFHGSPSFITDPGSFFLDAADQVTGAFLAQSGPLSQLCSPWNLDLRLTLALGVAGQKPQARYTCTLGKIIQNAKNANVQTGFNTTLNQNAGGNSVSLGLDAEGSGITSFLGGDFSQGGWAAFDALYTDPQNTPLGSYIIAQDDLNTAINNKQQSIDQDRNRGGGFLSYEECEAVPSGQSYYDANLGRQSVSTGDASNQTCRTETPGSVISSSLNKSLGLSADELVAADEINEVINALIGQLIQQVLYKGLASSSGGGSSDRNSVVNQLLNEKQQGTIANQQAADNTRTAQGSLAANLNPYLSATNRIHTSYQTAYDYINSIRTNYQAALGCYGAQTTGPNATFAQSQITRINTALTTRVNPLLGRIQARLDIINSTLTVLNRIADVSESTTATTVELQTAGTQLSNLIAQNALPTDFDVATAQSDSAAIQTDNATILVDAQQTLSSCQNSTTIPVTP